MYLTYVYFVKNKVTNQFYYGSRCKNVSLKKHAKEDLWVTYFTSSSKIKELRAMYGDDSFETSIIFESYNYDECYWFEQERIQQDITNPLCLNKYYFDRELGQKKFSSDGPCSENRRKAISKSKQGSKNSFFGKTHTLETKEKISKAGKGKSKTDITKHKMSIAATGHTRQIGENNSMYGKHHTIETKEKQKQAAILREQRKRAAKALIDNSA